MMNKDQFREIVEVAGPRQSSTRIKRNRETLAWVMEQTAALPADTSIPDRTTFILEGELLINLLEWAKRNSVTYSQAQKMVAEGTLRGKKIGGRVKVPFDAVPAYERIACAVCGGMFAFITGTHLNSHGMTIEEYKTRFPGAPTVSEEVSDKISDQMTGRERSEEHCKNISINRAGITPKNHPRYVIGSYKPTAATRAKMAESATGKTHNDETKKKIGDAHRGKTITQEAIEKCRASLAEFYRINPGFFKGKKHTLETRARMAEIAVEREAAYDPERRAEIGRLRGAKNLGKVRTDEQKETYRLSRTKWMSENPLRMKNTAGERTIMAWLEANGIEYKMQWLLPGESTANGYHPHDFFLPAYDTIIEFDGSHHWAAYWFNIKGKTDEQIAAMLEAQILKDAEENWAAGQAGYRIIRVRGYGDCGDSEWGSLEEQLELQGFLINT